MINLMEQWKRGETPKIGPQIDRQHSCGPMGRTSIYLNEFNPEYNTHSRDFAAAKKEWEEARAKAAAAAAAAKKWLLTYLHFSLFK